MDNLEFQINVMSRIMNSGTKQYRVFLCSRELLNHITNLSNIGTHSVHIKKSIKEFYNNKKDHFKSCVKESDSGLYVFDSRNVKDKIQFVDIAKHWYFYGARSESNVYMSFLDKDSKEGYFQDQLKLDFMSVDMANKYQIEFVLKDLNLC